MDPLTILRRKRQLTRPNQLHDLAKVKLKSCAKCLSLKNWSIVLVSNLGEKLLGEKSNFNLFKFNAKRTPSR